MICNGVADVHAVVLLQGLGLNYTAPKALGVRPIVLRMATYTLVILREPMQTPVQLNHFGAGYGGHDELQ
jgi:hypothetical protein